MSFRFYIPVFYPVWDCKKSSSWECLIGDEFGDELQKLTFDLQIKYASVLVAKN